MRVLRKSEVYVEPRKTRCVDNGFIRSTLCHQKPKKQQLQVFDHYTSVTDGSATRRKLKKNTSRSRKTYNKRTFYASIVSRLQAETDWFRSQNCATVVTRSGSNDGWLNSKLTQGVWLWSLDRLGTESVAGASSSTYSGNKMHEMRRGLT